VITRSVFRCRSDRQGNVVALASATGRWSPRDVGEVAADIRSGRFRYVIEWESGTSEVQIEEGAEQTCRLDALTPDGCSGGLRLLPKA
jgi:hypothetical protein